MPAATRTPVGTCLKMMRPDLFTIAGSSSPTVGPSESSNQSESVSEPGNCSIARRDSPVSPERTTAAGPNISVSSDLRSTARPRRALSAAKAWFWRRCVCRDIFPNSFRDPGNQSTKPARTPATASAGPDDAGSASSSSAATDRRGHEDNPRHVHCCPCRAAIESARARAIAAARPARALENDVRVDAPHLRKDRNGSCRVPAIRTSVIPPSSNPVIQPPRPADVPQPRARQSRRLFPSSSIAQQIRSNRRCGSRLCNFGKQLPCLPMQPDALHDHRHPAAARSPCPAADAIRQRENCSRQTQSPHPAAAPASTARHDSGLIALAASASGTEIAARTHFPSLHKIGKHFRASASSEKNPARVCPRSGAVSEPPSPRMSDLPSFKPVGRWHAGSLLFETAHSRQPQLNSRRPFDTLGCLHPKAYR